MSKESELFLKPKAPRKVGDSVAARSLGTPFSSVEHGKPFREKRVSRLAGWVMSFFLLNAPLAPNEIPRIEYPNPGVIPASAIEDYQPKSPINLMFYYGLTHDNMQESNDDHTYNIADWYVSTASAKDISESPIQSDYSLQDDRLLYEQIAQMSYANQDGAITSWDHKGDSRDQFLHHIKDVMHRVDNPNPLFKWAIVYEKEGYGDQGPQEITNDMDYLKDVFGDSFYLKDEQGRPYVFVYSAGNDKAEYAEKWAAIGKEKKLHIVLRQFQFYDTTMIPVVGSAIEKIVNPVFEDVSWYNYEPVYPVVVTRDAYIISPGFGPKIGDWRFVPRNINVFVDQAGNMVKSGKPLQIIETFNEVEENTGMNAADLQVLHELVPPNPKVSSPQEVSGASQLKSVPVFP